MSEIKVNKITPRVACGTTQLGDSGDTFTIPSGATITNAGTASGFGATGETSWDTTVKTATFTATAGIGYFCDTTSGVFTVNLPAGSAGDSVAVVDYANTFDSNALTVSPNGAEKINGGAGDILLSVEGQSLTVVYIDGTTGWKSIIDSTTSPVGSNFITATGGTPCAGQTSGDYKYHTFTGPGTFCVSSLSPSSPENVVSYMVVAAGGGSAGAPGGYDASSGGGAGGYREYKNSCDPYTASPLNGNPGGTAITVTATGFPITVGAAGAAGSDSTFGGAGNNSIFSSITSAGGGGGQIPAAVPTTQNGGSGAGGAGANPGAPAAVRAGGTGNTPPTTPSQGNDGGDGVPNGPLSAGGGGGGAGGAGTNAPGPATVAGAAGVGTTSSINATPTARGGGGGSGAKAASGGTGSDGGSGGGGHGGKSPSNPPDAGTAGTINTGGGGGAPTSNPAGSQAGAAGGSGIVIIRYKFQ
jgi:hypothetical protein